MLGPYALFLYGPSMNTDCPVHCECMYTAYRQSSQCTVKYGAAPHTWRNDSAELHERDTQQWHSKQVVHRCVWKVKGTSKHGTCVGVQKLKGIPFKELWYTQFQYKVWWYLYYLCTACSGRHFDTTHLHSYLCMYTLTTIHTYILYTST